MAIFSSLGSNYSLRFALQAIFASNMHLHQDRLLRYLEKKYAGKVTLVYKGREAIKLALRAINIPEKYTVGICGYTCYAVCDAVANEKYTIKYLDIDGNGLNFSLEVVKKMLQISPSMRILIIQNTLGYTVDILPLAEFCRAQGIILIEDLAHCVGATYSTGQEVGTVGDFTVLSFGQNKLVDGVSGGALVIRNQNFQVPNSAFSEVSFSQQLRDRFYPLVNYVIRKTYTSSLGRTLREFLKYLQQISPPITFLNTKAIYGLPSWYCVLIYRSFQSLEKSLSHRRKIASVYAENLDSALLLAALAQQIPLSANLRFPVLVENRDSLLQFLKAQGIYLSDIWYDSPIAPKKYMQLTDYDGQCLNSERVSALMVNLPTHGNVSENDARFIVAKLQYWLEKQ